MCHVAALPNECCKGKARHTMLVVAYKEQPRDPRHMEDGELGVLN